MVIDGTKITNVGIRPKGNSSLSMVAQDSTTDRYSFKIEFDHYVSGQTWLGLDKIVINNMQGDSTYLKEYLSYDIMDYAGVETPLYTFSNISVNGEVWGFYLAVESLEDSYATRVYGNDHGKLYKPESMGIRGNGQMNEVLAENENGTLEGSFPEEGNEVETQGGNLPQQGNEVGQPPTGDPGGMPTEGAPNAMQGGGGGGLGGETGGTTLQYTDEEISSYSAIFENAVFISTDQDYTRVIEALHKLSTGEDLDSVVDVEATLKYFAAHAVIVNLDSYVSNMSHNYYLYEDDGQLTMLPWDFNLAFGGFQSDSASSVVNFPIDTPVSGINLEDRPILAKLLEVPEYLDLYHSYLNQIVDGYSNSGLFEASIDSLDTLISPYVEADPTAFYDFSSYQSGVQELTELGLLRAKSIEGQLAGTIPATTAGQTADATALVDASSIDLTVLGNMGGGGRNGGNGELGSNPAGEATKNDGSNMNPGMMQGLDQESMAKAMEIIQAAGEDELSEEQLAQLHELGFTEEQITMMTSRQQGGFTPGGERHDNLPNEANGPPQGDNQGQTRTLPQEENQSAVATSVTATTAVDSETWIVLGVSTALLFGGLLFVIFYKRRRTA